MKKLFAFVLIIGSLSMLPACGGGSPTEPSAPSAPSASAPVPAPPPAPIWSFSGSGDIVFDMPRTVRRVKIAGDYTKNSSNFIVHIDGNHVVNELLGTFWGSTHFEGTYLTNGGVVEVLHSSGVTWSFNEVR